MIVRTTCVFVLLSHACLASAGANDATSNVRLFGTIDLAYVNSSASGMRRSGIESGVHELSVFGLHADEKISDNLRAVVHLEYSISPDTNSGLGAPQFGAAYAARNQYLGLESSWGSLQVGRVGSPLNYLSYCDAANGVPFSPLQSLLATAYNYRGNPTRLSNTVRYMSPTMAGWTASVGYGFAPFADDKLAYVSKQERLLATSLHYVGGPLSFVIINQRTESRALTPLTADLEDWGLGFTYDLKVVKLNLALLDSRKTGPAGRQEYQQWVAGLTAPLARLAPWAPGAQKWQLRIAYGNVHNNTTRRSDASGWVIGADYALSKRSTLYLMRGEVNNDPLAAFSPDTYNRPVPGDKASAFALGISHSF